jgi:hypothetical protein
MNSHPEQAGWVLFEQTLVGLHDRANPIRSEDAVRQLIDASRAMQAAGKVRDFTARLQALRNEFRARADLMNDMERKRKQVLLF